MKKFSATIVRRILWMFCLSVLLMNPNQVAYADNCGSLSDCYYQITVAVLVVLAITVFILVLLEIAAASAVMTAGESMIVTTVAAEEAVAAAAIASAEGTVIAEAAAAGTVTAETVIATGSVGARLGGVLKTLETALVTSKPTTALGALKLVHQATASVGLEVGIATGTTAGGSIVITNVGGVITYLFNNGQVLIMRGSQILLNIFS